MTRLGRHWKVRLPNKKILFYPSLVFEGQEESIDFPQYRGLTFREFWDTLPKKLKYYDYEEEIEQALGQSKYLWVKKSVGLGMTEWVIRWVAWNCLKDDVWKNDQVDINVILITGPSIDLAITIINRLKALFDREFNTKETLCILNGNRIQAFPSHHVATAHGLNPKLVFIDEGDLFPPSQQELVREVAERYIAKSNPYIIFVSTPYNPGGLYEKIEKENNCLYTRKIMLYDRGMNKVYSPEQIEIAKQSPSFEREYNGKYGFGVGNIFQGIDQIIRTYDLTIGQGNLGLYVDPAYGSSKFGIVGLEKIDGIIYVKEATQYERPSPSAMIDIVVAKARLFGSHCKVDGAHPGFIRDLIDKGIPAVAVEFNKELSNMTIESAQAVKEKRVLIHPIFTDLIAQIRAVRFNMKGHPDKTKLTFDLGDALMMGLNDMKIHDYRSIGVGMDGEIINFNRPKKSSLIMKTEVFE